MECFACFSPALTALLGFSDAEGVGVVEQVGDMVRNFDKREADWIKTELMPQAAEENG